MLAPVFGAGETYAVPRDIDRAGALAYWLAPEKTVFLARIWGRAAGTYYLRANQAGPGAHVANCGYITAAWAQGQGVARPVTLVDAHVKRAIQVSVEVRKYSRS